MWESLNVGGALPFIGTIINGAKAVTHAGMAGIDAIAGDSENAKDHLSMAAMDTVKAIPFGVGTAATVSELLYDTHAGRPTEEHLFDPSAPARQQTAQQDIREWMFGRRADGRETQGLW
ncbi:MAG: hypothetical protein K8W52_10610 [Deltaproteobacteria bacterium]|nr:hypothetical protein [Deltaproteobacteria bacterium]